MDREDIKAERVALLDLQTDLNSICRKCEEAVYRYSNEQCARCQTFEQLNGIGDRLLELTRIERAQQSKPINLGISHNRKRGDGVLNVEKFVWLRKDGLSFTEIAYKLGVTVQYVSQFKTKYEKEIQAYLDKNGIAIKEDDGKMAAVTPEQYVKFKHEEKLTQKQMADRLGVTQSTISMWKSKNIAKIKECEKLYFSKKKAEEANSNVTTEEIVAQVKEDTGANEEDTGANEEEIVETLENFAEGEKEEMLDQEEVLDRNEDSNFGLAQIADVKQANEFEQSSEFEQVPLSEAPGHVEDVTKKKGSKAARRLGEIRSMFENWRKHESANEYQEADECLLEFANKHFEWLINLINRGYESVGLEPEKEVWIKSDNINPNHYKTGGIETFDYMQAKLTSHELDGYMKGNIIKYVSRERLKNGTEDLKKAQWYLDKLVEIRGK